MVDEKGPNPYSPYPSREDADREYKSLREELLESQKQRVALLSGSIAVIGGLFSYIAKDGHFLLSQAMILIVLGAPVPYYVYSTRLRERRVAAFIAVYMKGMSFWSTANPHFNIFQRSSTAMVGGLIFFDVSLLLVSHYLSPESWAGASFCAGKLSFNLLFLVLSCLVIFSNFIALYCLSNLPDYATSFRKALEVVETKKPSAKNSLA